MFNNIFLKNSKIYKKKKYFNISNYKPYFFNEVKGFKFAEYPRLKNKNFWKKKKYKKIEKLIIVSGPGRSGNHLTISLLDPISNVVGEDSFLINILTKAKKNEKQLIQNLKSGNKNFYLKLSGYLKNGKSHNKWLETYKIFKKIEKKSSKEKKKYIIKNKFTYSGLQRSGDKFDLDFRLFVPNLNYKGFENYFSQNKNKFKNIKNIFEFIELYSEASQILVGVKERDISSKRFIFASGMRRESYFLLNKYAQKHIIICPIRNFNEFAMSHLVSDIFKNNFLRHDDLKKKIFLYYEMWFHKVIDLLILKKRFSKNVIILRFEDLINKKKKTLNLLFKKIKEPLKKINLKPTILKKNILGNSSYDFIKNRSIKIEKKFKKDYLLKEFDRKIIYSNEYKKIIKYLNKVKLQ